MVELLEFGDPLELLGLLLCFGCIFTVGIIGYVLDAFLVPAGVASEKKKMLVKLELLI